MELSRNSSTSGGNFPSLKKKFFPHFWMTADQAAKEKNLFDSGMIVDHTVKLKKFYNAGWLVILPVERNFQT